MPADTSLAISPDLTVEEHVKRHGKRLDTEERSRKKTARLAHKQSSIAQSMHGRKAKLMHQQRYSEKVALRKLLKEHDERKVKAGPSEANEHKEALPSYLLDREEQNNAKVLSSALKQRRKDKAGKFAVPLPKVRGISEEEAFRVIKTGKSRRKGWKRVRCDSTRLVAICRRADVGSLPLHRADGHESYVRQRVLHAERAKTGAIRPAHGAAIQEGKCYAPGAEGGLSLCKTATQLLSVLTLPFLPYVGHLPASHHWRQEEPPVANVHATRCSHQGYNHRGERVRARYGDHRRKGRLGQGARAFTDKVGCSAARLTVSHFDAC